MSQYIEFYIKAQNEYLPIGIFSRNSEIYKIANDTICVPSYSKVAPLTIYNINNIIDSIELRQKDYEKRIVELEEEKKLIATFNNSVAEKTETIFNINIDIEEYRDMIKDAEAALGYYVSLLNIIDSISYTSKYDKNEYIYFGIECENPNEEKNNESN